MSLRMPDRPSDRQMAPWEAVLAQALQQDEPERTALEEIPPRRTTPRTPGTSWRCLRRSGGWTWSRRSTRWCKSASPPREYERYMKDPERPAFLQALREHEIGGRRIEDVLDSITAAPLTGLRSIAAVLHGRAGKEPAPARGRTSGMG